MKRILLTLAALALVIGIYASGQQRIHHGQQPAAEMQALRASLSEARFSADSCKAALAWEEQGFQRFDRLVDSLRAEVESYEDPTRGGVPYEEYDAYMESFTLYNDSVDVWQGRVDSLQIKEAACRALVEAHNNLGDSIRRRREEWSGGAG